MEDHMSNQQDEQHIEPPVGNDTQTQSTTTDPEDYKSKWMRALSDYQNLQKETALQRGEWIRMSELQIIEEFLPVYSNFKKAFAAGTEQSGWAKGIEYIMKQFGDVLKAHGVEEIKTTGETLDTNLHEAVGEEESADIESGKIIREVDTGYKMKDKIVKVAKVVVAK
jgi:molecular chaperone GrpE